MEQRDIVIVTDFEEGHFYPLFGMARDLEKAGYSIYFVGILDTAETIEKSGFDCIPVFKKMFPKGYVHNLRDNRISIDSVSNDFIGSIFDEFDSFMPTVQPKIILTSSFFSIVALLIHYKYGVKQIIFRTHFHMLSDNSAVSMGEISSRLAIQSFMKLSSQLFAFFMEFFKTEKLIFKKFDDMTAPLRKMPHVMLCPMELDITSSKPNRNEIYLGPGIESFENQQNAFLTEVLKKKGSRKIIYASMGSQTKEYPKKAELVFNTLLETMKSDYWKDFYLILSVGSSLENWNLVEFPKNADVHSWVPQIDILPLASMAIIHGGLGSIKECIFFGTPMLVVPMGRDQIDNSLRIEHHEIGYSLNFNQVTKETLNKKLIELYENKKRQQNLEQMQHVFQEKEKQNIIVKLVQSII